MTPELHHILVRLADSHRKALRKSQNREFYTFGPGPEWDRYKASPGYQQECEEIRLLREFCGLKEEV